MGERQGQWDTNFLGLSLISFLVITWQLKDRKNKFSFFLYGFVFLFLFLLFFLFSFVFFVFFFFPVGWITPRSSPIFFLVFFLQKFPILTLLLQRRELHQWKVLRARDVGGSAVLGWLYGGRCSARLLWVSARCSVKWTFQSKLVVRRGGGWSRWVVVGEGFRLCKRGWPIGLLARAFWSSGSMTVKWRLRTGGGRTVVDGWRSCEPWALV